jgi:ribosome-binding protein aMBF1 (putative translation factor)
MGDFSNHYSEGMVVIRGVAILRIAASSILLMAKDLNLHERLISELGVVLQERRARLHMSQSDLAESSRFHRSYISDVERGARNISVKNLSRLALALDIPVSTILVQVEKRLSSKSGRARKRA